ncbi:hypothetical protein MWU75_00310 [Ornithinimicrobium sp. F0845]|uniref:hypothetical protein n=1 Tax=Ornithinimicrobium sp. F0845 TaxID=2926412 RepID=UPI001FF2F90E|nr:hypothetical protein [Ornithinimicrobium sp. F0845]MCK0110589.1 hypothetical protein [Ornithinimicrobium sp. F0845]
MSDLREFLDRGVAGAPEVDLVEGVWRTARRRRRNRRLVAGSAVVAVALGGFAVSQWDRAPVDLAPAVETTPSPGPVDDLLVANQAFLAGMRASGLQVDYRPLKSPTLAISPAAAYVVVGEVWDVRARGDDFVVTVDVAETIPEDFLARDRIDVLLDSGPLHEVTPQVSAAVGGPVLVVLRNQVQPVDESAPVRPYVDGFWIDVPGGIGNPYTDYADMRADWPPVGSVEELADVLSEAEVAARRVPPPLPVECSTSWQNPPPLNSTGLSALALQTANDLIGMAATCDEEALIARALADGTVVAVGEGDVGQQLATPDDNDAYLRLEATFGVPATREGDQHVFELEGWRVVVASDGRWVEFSRE